VSPRTPRTIDGWIADPQLPHFSPERRDAEMSYLALRCRCGGEVFRVAGWPRAALGQGAYFWRSFMRVWREARQPMSGGEPVESPFLFPLMLRCDRCDRQGPLFASYGKRGEAIEGAPVDPVQPRESYRCPACRRGRVELVIGVTPDRPGAETTDGSAVRAAGTGQGESDAEGARIAADGGAVEVVARCHACRREARVAWADARPSPQQIRLDQLYGRR
jgi:hypothetical protein